MRLCARARALYHTCKKISTLNSNISPSQKNQEPKAKHPLSPTKIPLEVSKFHSRGKTTKNLINTAILALEVGYAYPIKKNTHLKNPKSL